MSRDKLIAKYAALNTEDLPNRIYDEIDEFITLWGIDDMPYMVLSGRWTGTLTISNGGWHNQHDLHCQLLSLCRVDRNGLVSPDMVKIVAAVQRWQEWLCTPTEYDDDGGYSDDKFRDDAYTPDSTEHMSTAEKYLAATELGDYTSAYDFDFQTSGSKELFDNLLDHMQFEKVSDEEREDGVSIRVFKANLTPDKKKIDKADDDSDQADDDDDREWVEEGSDEFEELKKILSSIGSPDTNQWVEFVNKLRNGEFGELPEDYDGLALDADDDSDNPDEDQIEF